MGSGNNPWGRAIGLLAGCVVMVIGVLCKLDPDVILFRAVVAAVVLGVATRVVRAVAVQLF